MRELYEGLMMSPEEKAAMLAEEQAKAAARRKKDPDQAAGDGAGFGSLGRQSPGSPDKQLILDQWNQRPVDEVKSVPSKLSQLEH